ncbi:MAG: hypothetical protein FWH57_11815, partial [Oscillospiraceae bacterium]|nr:hypothetical protein [Oscillospiraceae bacterium]
MMTGNLQTSKTVTTVNDKATKFQLRLMMLYIVAVYIPFIIILLASPYNVFVTSLSKIAWRYDGLPLIILYGTLTIPFLLYEIHFYLKYNKRDKDALIRPLLAGCFILGVG